GYHRDANGVEIRDNETELQFLETRFVKLTAGGAFDGLQNHLANRRTDLRIVGAVLAAPGLTGTTSGMSGRLLWGVIVPHCPSTCASAASAWGSQNVMSMARYRSMAVVSAARACSCCPVCV